MHRATDDASKWRRGQTALLGLTLVTSAVHFADNAMHLDLYPGPAWLTQKIVLATWLIVPVAAFVAYRSDARIALFAYALFGFDGPAHYLMLQGMQMPLRCTVTIWAEVAASMALVACTLIRPAAQ